ncbi:MAG TPA: NAD-dependent epimerase/dehydratase family protein [archaeon]|nr:NAD-dependent epimerase/dehydratase family protein [archaeon]
MKSETLVVTGAAGSVGHDILYYLSVTSGVGKIIAADVAEIECRSQIKEIVVSANFLGHYPDISFRKLDLFDVNATAAAIKQIDPRVICHCATLGSWWITRLLPPEEYHKVSPLGPWLPNHLTLALNLMRAVKKAGTDTKVINAAFPDLSNVVLTKLGLMPVCGGGNMDFLCAFVRYVVSRELKIQTNDIFVYGVGHHGAYYTARMGEPYYLKILARGEDVTDKFPHDKLRKLCYAEGFFDRPQLKGPLVNQFRVAASFLQNTLAVYFNTRELRMSVPGPNGLPGAYPCRLGQEGAEIVLPDDMTLKNAIEINETGARFDGIETVRDDGTVVYLDQNVRDMDDVLGYRCKELRISEIDERAKELNTKLNRCYQKHAT